MPKIILGQRAEISKKFTQEDVKLFADLSLDFNPVHLSEEYAKNSMFGDVIVHGMLVSSLFSALLGKHLPGEGTIYLGQNLKFNKPVFLNQEVTASVEVINIREDKNIITLSTVCKNDQDDVVISGEAVVIFNE